MKSLLPFVLPVAILLTTCGCGNRHQVAVQTANYVDSSSSGDNLEPVDPVLLKPSLSKDTAPDKFQVMVSTTKGEFVIDVTRDWSPRGADRFYNLVKIGFFKNIAVFRAIEGFMFQFGIHGNPKVSAQWANATFQDDPPNEISNTVGTVSFAKTGAPNSRSSQIFINLGDNVLLDGQGFTPFGIVTDGSGVLGQINTEYGENGKEVQPFFKAQGNAYIKNKFPNADYIKSMKLIEP